jgi:hypothetical protein
MDVEVRHEVLTTTDRREEALEIRSGQKFWVCRRST